MDAPTDLRRRQVLAGLSALGAGTLAGCRHYPSVDAVDLDRLPASPPVLPKHSIDVHTHFFNASDASVIGYLTHSILHEKPALQFFLKRMDDVLKALVKIAPSARTELNRLRNVELSRSSDKSLDAFLSNSRTSERWQIAQALAEQMRTSGVSLEFRKGVRTEKGLEPVPTRAEEIFALLDPKGEDATNPNKLFLLPRVDIAGIFRFLGCMLGSRSSALRVFRDGHEPRGISAAFGAMVDFDHFYPDPARSPLADQVELHSLLARQSGGYMLPLFPYNPFADIKTNGGRLRMLTQAVEEHGFIGVKIYPPVGFRPTNNLPEIDGLDSRELNATLARFFSECHRLSIPVMAHAHSTRGRGAYANQHSHPDGWEDLIKEMAARDEVPLLNFGHFGGHSQNTPRSENNNWPVLFAELMEKEGGQRIYGDLGNWSSLHSCRTDPKPCRASLLRLTAAREANPELDKRLMYGSDFYMMVVHKHWSQWPTEVAGALSTIGLDLDRVFHRNAMECFGLLPNGSNRLRLEKFFAGKLPAWMS